jgi:hypothetical protein
MLWEDEWVKQNLIVTERANCMVSDAKTGLPERLSSA